MVKRTRAFIQAILACWGKDNATQLAAAVAFFAALSLAPLVIIAVAIAGFVFGEETARAELVAQAQEVIGSAGAEVIGTVLEQGADPGQGMLALVIGIGGLFFTASNIFVQLQTAFNRIWDVAPSPKSGVRSAIIKRVSALLKVIGAGLLFVTILLLGAAASMLRTLFSEQFPGTPLVWSSVDFVLSVALFTLIFALIFKVIPQVAIRWHDVWLGALVTSLLFTIGKTLLALYLGGNALENMYGAAGSLLVLLIWIFYTTQVVFVGAQFTQVYARVRGHDIRPADGAVPLAEAQRVQHEKIDEQIALARGERPSAKDGVSNAPT
jgi:membrane protein